MEKFKDWIHDFTDVLLAFVIVLAMFAVVAFNLGDWFNFSKDVSAAEIPKNVIEENTESKLGSDDPVVIITEDEEDVEDVEEIDAEEEANEEFEVVEVESEVEDTSSPITVVEVKEITIPNGTPGVGIAKLLHDNGLIENTGDFIKKAEDLNLDVKLKSGTFLIPTNATIEEMVKIIAKTN